MTAAFLVDLNSTITPNVAVTVDGSGAPTMHTVDGSGSPISTPLSGGGGGAPASTTISPAASGTGAVGTGTSFARNDHAHPVSGGVPVALATGHTFINADNAATVIASGTPGYVINTGLMAGWGVAIKGAFTLTGTATVSDDRQTTGIAWCCIEQTDTTGAGLTYDLVGTK